MTVCIAYSECSRDSSVLVYPDFRDDFRHDYYIMAFCKSYHNTRSNETFNSSDAAKMAMRLGTFTWRGRTS